MKKEKITVEFEIITDGGLCGKRCPSLKGESHPDIYDSRDPCFCDLFNTNLRAADKDGRVCRCRTCLNVRPI
jgi:hypothetical protein